MSSKRVLFVDDDENILQGLKRMLRSMRREWNMAFVSSGQDALALMEEQHFDVVVSDMRMPGMDGAQLLNEIKRRYPDVVRIVLSGHADRELIMSSLGATHQYLSKPCDGESLKAAVARAFSLNKLFKEDPSFKPLISRIQTLPSLPSLYQKIMEELQSPNASINRIGKVIAQDPAMSAKILQLVNSSFFGLTKPVSDPKLAVQLLGIDTVRSLVLSAQVFQLDENAPKELDLNELWRHSSMVGIFAKRIATAEGASEQVRGDAMMAGILHDIGQLVLSANLPEEYWQLLQMVKRREADLFELERMYFGASHAEIGAYLLGLWRLPNTIVEIVANHHYPVDPLNQEFSALAAVHVANALAHELMGTGDNAEETVKMEFLGNWACQLPVWRELCRDILECKGDRDTDLPTGFSWTQ